MISTFYQSLSTGGKVTFIVVLIIIAILILALSAFICKILFSFYISRVVSGGAAIAAIALASAVLNSGQSVSEVGGKWTGYFICLFLTYSFFLANLITEPFPTGELDTEGNPVMMAPVAGIIGISIVGALFTSTLMTWSIWSIVIPVILLILNVLFLIAGIIKAVRGY